MSFVEIKYAYFHDDDDPSIIVREALKYGDTEGTATAQYWDYKNEKWVTSASAWEILDQGDEKLWTLPEDYVQEYIAKMLKRFPREKEYSVIEKVDGATRKRVKRGDYWYTEW